MSAPPAERDPQEPGGGGGGLAVYLSPRALTTLALGVTCGLPYSLTHATLGYWLSAEGASLKAVGLFAFAALPYSLKFLWAPLVDARDAPLFGRVRGFGRRQGWMALAQVGLALCLALIALCDPTTQLTALAALVVSSTFFAATQDIAVDAWRVETFAVQEQGAAAAWATLGYRVGMFASSGGAILMSAWLPWRVVYLSMAALVAAGVGVTALSGRVEGAAQPVAKRLLPVSPPASPASPPLSERLRALSPRALAARARELWGARWVRVLLFVALFRLGDHLLSLFLYPSLNDLGFTPVEIATVAKTWGLVATFLGTFAGGWLVYRWGLGRVMALAGVAQALSNLALSGQALAGRDVELLYVTIGVQDFALGLVNATFVAYLSSLCDPRSAATHFALLSALSGLLKTLCQAGSGWVAEGLRDGYGAQRGWALYFAFTSLAALPGLALLWGLRSSSTRAPSRT